MAILTLAFALGSLWLGLDTSYRRWTIVTGALGVSAFVVFALNGLSILLPILFRYPVIIADEHGAFFRTSFFMSGYVPWSASSGVRALSFSRAKYVVIDLLDAKELIKTQPFWLRPLLGYCASTGWPACVILVDCRNSSSVHKDAAASLRALRKVALNLAQPNAPEGRSTGMPAERL